MIHVQCLYGRFPTCGFANAKCPIFTPSKVAFPLLTTRIKQLDPPSRFRVFGLRSVMLISVAPPTGQTQVVVVRCAPQRCRYNMVDCHWDASLFGTRETIFATVGCPLSDVLSLARRNSLCLHLLLFIHLMESRQLMAPLLKQHIGFRLDGCQLFSFLYQLLHLLQIVRHKLLARFVLID